MKLKYFSRLFLAASAITFLTTSCGDDDTYAPGDPVSDDCMGVYFSSDNESQFIFSPEELEGDYSIDVTVTRVKSDKAADIPVIVENADACFKVPATVHFDEGEDEAVLKVEFPEITRRVESKFQIRIPDEYVNLYSSDDDAANRYVGRILVSEWIKIIKDAWFYDYPNGDQFNYLCDIYWLAGSNRFLFENWMESGIDVTFELESAAFDANNPETWKGVIYPYDNYYFRDIYNNGWRWYLYDDAKGERVAWTTSTGATQKTNVTFYSNSTQCNFNMTGSTTGRAAYIYKLNSTSGWIYGYWDEMKIDGYDD